MPVGPGARLGQAGQFGQGRCTARPRAERSGHRLAVRGGHGDPAAVQPAGPADQFGAEAFRPGGLPLVVPAGHHPSRRARTAGASTAPVTARRPGGRRSPRRRGGASPCSGCRPSRSTRPRPVPVHRRDADPGGTRTAGGGVPNEPGTNQDHVVGVLRRWACGLSIDRGRPRTSSGLATEPGQRSLLAETPADSGTGWS